MTDSSKSSKVSRAELRRRLIGKKIRANAKTVFKKHFEKDKLSNVEAKKLVTKEFANKSKLARTKMLKKMGMSYNDRLKFENEIFGGKLSNQEVENLAKKVKINKDNEFAMETLKKMAEKGDSVWKMKEFARKQERMTKQRIKTARMMEERENEKLQGIDGPNVGFQNQDSVKNEGFASKQSASRSTFSGAVEDAKGLTGGTGGNVVGIGGKLGKSGGGSMPSGGGAPIGFRKAV